MSFLRPPPKHPLQVIIADDHEWIRKILVQVVRDALPVVDVVDTADGLEALVAFQTGHCDFLISNHCMPHMNGPSLIRHVRDEAPDLPIVMVSTKPRERAEAMAAGANWFLAKDQIMEWLPQLLLKHTAKGTHLEAGDGVLMVVPRA